MLNKILGINWRTTLAGFTSLLAVVGAIVAAWKVKDFRVIVDKLPELFLAISVVATAIGLMKAKDQNVTGTGAVAKSVDSSGIVTNREGEVVGKQPVVP